MTMKNSHPTPRLTLAASALLALAMLFSAGCQIAIGDDKNKKEEEEKDKALVYVEAIEARRGAVAKRLTSTATLQADRQVDILTRLNGEFESVTAEEGDIVRKGQTLARLRSEEKSLLLLQAQTKADNADREFERAKIVFEKKLLSVDEFEKLEYQNKLALADLEVAKYNLSETYLRAPFDGIVTERLVDVGQTMRPSEVAFRLADMLPMEAVIYLSERDVSLVRNGQPVRLTLDADSDIFFAGRVDMISPVVDPATGTVKLTLAVDKAPEGVRPGAFVRVYLDVDEKPNALLVPKRALIQSGETSHVFVVGEDKTVHRLDITTGYSLNDWIEIQGDLQPGDRVVTLGKEALHEGSKVRVAADS